MPEPSLTGPLLLGLATRLGPLLAAPAPLLGVRLGDLAEELGARTGPVLRTLNQAVTQLVAAGHCTLDAFPGSDPLADAGTRVLLTPAGLAAARTREARIGQPGPTQVSSLAMDLGAEFQEGRLVAPRLHSTPADLGRHAAAEPWVLPVLLLLWLEPRWYLNVLATLLQFLARMDRVDLGSAARTLGTAKGLGDRCTTLVPFLPALYLGKDRGQRT